MKVITKTYRFLLIIAGAVFLYSLVSNGMGRHSIDMEKLKLLVESLGIWGGIIFIGISSIRPFLLLPSPVLFLLGGVIYGGFLGSILNLAGLLAGASLCRFLAGRFQVFFLKILGTKYLKKLELLQGEQTIKTLFIMRVTPGFPFDPISYGAGLAGISYHHFFIGTLLGSTPKVFLYTFLGDGIDEIFSLRTLGVFFILILLACLPLIFTKKPDRSTNH